MTLSRQVGIVVGLRRRIDESGLAAGDHGAEGGFAQHGLLLGFSAAGPDQGSEPSEYGPSQQQVQQEDAVVVVHAAHSGNERGQKVQHAANYHQKNQAHGSIPPVLKCVQQRSTEVLHQNGKVNTPFLLTFECVERRVMLEGFATPSTEPSAFPRTQRVASSYKRKAHMGAGCRLSGDRIAVLTAGFTVASLAPSTLSQEYGAPLAVRSTAMATEPVCSVAPMRRFELNPRPEDLGGGWQVKLYEGNTECGGGVFPPDAETDPDGSWAWSDAYAMGVEWAGVHEEPVVPDNTAITLSVPLPDPVPGDPYTYLASGPNAAIALAAAMESADEQRLTELMSAFASSAEYALLKQCYRADQRRILVDDTTDAAEREEFILDLALSRMFLAGTRYAALPKEMRNAA